MHSIYQYSVRGLVHSGPIWVSASNCGSLFAFSDANNRVSFAGLEKSPKETSRTPVAGPPDSDDDAISRNTETGERLAIQVVRANIDTGFWFELAQQQTATIAKTANELTNMFLEAVTKKKVRTPAQQRAVSVLAIDANRCTCFILNSVRNLIVAKHGAHLSALRYRSIWLVGPSADLTYQLVAQPEL